MLLEIIHKAQKELAAAGVDHPALDARLLIGHALGCDRAQLMMQSRRVLTDEEIAAILKLIERRARRVPVARILGLREFWGLPFGLNEATLEPRPDSETLIEAALRIPFSNGRLLDLGTGTGCLLLALLHEWPEATGMGVDIAPRAVEQARANAERLGLADRATFRVNSWADGVTERFDLIISNPPYIASGEISGLMPEVRDYDPRAALDGGSDGLDVYRHLIPRLPRLLNPQGAAIFEVGQGQATAVADLLRQSGFPDVATCRDLGGVERCVMGTITRAA
ncbi:MAG: peptide chain release factor N(5)-glutamine methyltransferase [Alphaproteobacteria bacterium]|nr:peptide chain release factor N(5)-glutamine methyltransferase [Alphaproteobacteria bacterium]